MSSYAMVAGSKPASSTGTSTPVITPTSSKSDTEQHLNTNPARASSEHAAALAKPVSFYEKKTRQMYQAMQDIWNGRYTFQQTAGYYGYTPEELGTAFAVFGVQAMDIVQQRNVVSSYLASPGDSELTLRQYRETIFRAMALNKDGYSTEIQHTLPRAFRQKNAEAEAGGRAALFQQVQRVNHTGKELANRAVASAGGYTQPVRGKLPLPKLPGHK